MKDWFAVDKKGLGQILERRGRSFAVLELVSNAWDQTVTHVDVTLTKMDKRAKYELTVTDDDPDGFADLTHAFTLFAPSIKKGDAEKRGRFNLGEKLVLALCDEAVILSTKGGVRFDEKGRHNVSERRDAGSVFRATLQLTRADFDETCEVMRTLIARDHCVTTFNGDVIPARTPVHVFTAALATEFSDEDGNLRPSTRNTTVSVYEPLPDETPTIYELGIPVVENGDRWHYDVGQKVPLNMDRDNVKPAYLRHLRTLVLNEMFDRITHEDANATWTKEAIEDPRVTEQAVRAVITKKYGDKVVAFDPSDQEANKIATLQGYTVVGGRSLSKQAWANVKQFDLIQPAGRVTPSPSAIMREQLSGERDIEVPEAKWSQDQRVVAEYARQVSTELLGVAVKVAIVSDITLNADAFYGSRKLSFNVGRLGHKWFKPSNELEVDALLIHELAHDRVGDHLSEDFHDECCRLGAKMRNMDVRLGTLAEFLLSEEP